MRRVRVLKRSADNWKMCCITSVVAVLSFIAGISYIYAGPYADSAHGNNTYGVSRSSLSSFNYSRGNCAHCHEQHASIGGSEPSPVNGSASEKLLFQSTFASQSTTFCFPCHQDSSIQPSMPPQYLYSYKYGGDSGISCPDSIKEAFAFINNDGTHSSNCGSSTGSSHQLSVIQNFIKNRWEFGNVAVNPCSACHNPHKAKRAYYPVGTHGTSPLSRPGSHGELWGDDTSERMSSYTSSYQAPYYYNSTISYEPDGDTTNNGSNMPDYVSLCTDCHNPSNDNQISSSQKYNFTGNFQGVLFNPDWEGTSPHGKIDGVKQDSMERKAPYTASINYVLSCTDCHEPHGSSNGMLIRKEVNGENVVTFTSWTSRDDWFTLCRRCHDPIRGHDTGNKGSSPCYVCHMHNSNWFRPI